MSPSVLSYVSDKKLILAVTNVYCKDSHVIFCVYAMIQSLHTSEMMFLKTIHCNVT